MKQIHSPRLNSPIEQLPAAATLEQRWRVNASSVGSSQRRHGFGSPAAILAGAQPAVDRGGPAGNRIQRCHQALRAPAGEKIDQEMLRHNQNLMDISIPALKNRESFLQT